MRTERRAVWPAGGVPNHHPIAPVETVEVWYGGRHPYEPSIEGDSGSPCKVCKPWGIGAHVHYPAYEYVAPKTVHTVTYSDYEDERFDSAWYDEAKADARAETLNRGLWADDRTTWTEARDRFAPMIATMTDAEIARADAAAIAAGAKEPGVRRAAREVRDAIGGHDSDPREAVAYAEAILAQTFEEWMEKSPGPKWRAGGIDVEDHGG